LDRRALFLALPLAAACTVKTPTVALTAVCAPPAEADKCLYEATCGAQYIGVMGVDASRTHQLILALEAANQAPKNNDSSAGRVSTADAYIQEVRVTYTGGLALAASSFRLIQRVPANGTSVIAFPVIDVGPGMLPAGVAEAVVVARVTAQGVFGDGSTFETPEYEIPFTICDDCLGNACPGGVAPTAACPDGMATPRVGQAPNSYKCP